MSPTVFPFPEPALFRQRSLRCPKVGRRCDPSPFGTWILRSQALAHRVYATQDELRLEFGQDEAIIRSCSIRGFRIHRSCLSRGIACPSSSVAGTLPEILGTGLTGHDKAGKPECCRELSYFIDLCSKLDLSYEIVVKAGQVSRA